MAATWRRLQSQLQIQEGKLGQDKSRGAAGTLGEAGAESGVWATAHKPKCLWAAWAQTEPQIPISIPIPLPIPTQSSAEESQQVRQPATDEI